MKTKLLFTALSIVLLFWPKTAAATCSTFGGRAVVVQANVTGIAPVVLSDTGNINSTGGINDASLLRAAVPGLLSGEVMSATAGGHGTFSQSVASLANLNLTVAGNTIGAGFVAAHANASCGSGGLTASGRTEIGGLVINGLHITVTGSPNQTLSLLGGAVMILNEQASPQNGSITVNAIHVKLPGVIDVVIASAFAALSGQLIGAHGGPLFFVGLLLQDVVINGPCSPGGDFFATGGGWISPTPNNDQGNFGLSGGFRQDGTPFGHLEYVDHGNGLNVHGTGVTGCIFAGGVVEITGTADVSGPASYSGPSGSFFYVLDVADNDASGMSDSFEIQLFSTSPTCTEQQSPSPPLPSTCTTSDPSDPFYTASGSLGSGGNGGGDIEFHPD